jgi:hypothetical protein
MLHSKFDPPSYPQTWAIECGMFHNVFTIHQRLSNPGCILDIENTFCITYTSESGTYIAKWKEEVLKMTAALKPFSAFLDSK